MKIGRVADKIVCSWSRRSWQIHPGIVDHSKAWQKSAKLSTETLMFRMGSTFALRSAVSSDGSIQLFRWRPTSAWLSRVHFSKNQREWSIDRSAGYSVRWVTRFTCDIENSIGWLTHCWMFLFLPFTVVNSIEKENKKMTRIRLRIRKEWYLRFRWRSQMMTPQINNAGFICVESSNEQVRSKIRISSHRPRWPTARIIAPFVDIVSLCCRFWPLSDRWRFWSLALVDSAVNSSKTW